MQIPITIYLDNIYADVIHYLPKINGVRNGVI